MKLRAIHQSPPIKRTGPDQRRYTPNGTTRSRLFACSPTSHALGPRAAVHHVSLGLNHGHGGKLRRLSVFVTSGSVRMYFRLPLGDMTITFVS
jgi:hypothetical protein